MSDEHRIGERSMKERRVAVRVPYDALLPRKGDGGSCREISTA